MIKAGVGLSLATESVSAAKEAAAQAMEQGGIKTTDWAVVFCTFPHAQKFESIISVIREITGTENISGCSGLGILTGFEEIEAEPAVAVMVVSSESIKATSFLVNAGGDGGQSSGIKIGEMLSPLESENNLLILLPDAFLVQPELLFRGVESKLGDIDIVGAAASLHPGMNETYQFSADGAAKEAVSGLLLQGNYTYAIGITQGCQPVGVPSVITNAESNIIFEINEMPAFEFMKQQVPARILNDRNNLFHLVFAAFPLDPADTEFSSGEYLVRNIMGINEDTGVVAVADNVKEGQLMQFTVRHPTMAREDLKQMLDRLSGGLSDERQIKFGFYFNCLARGSSLYGTKGIDTAYISSALGDFPLIGFFGNSEFSVLKGTNYLFTYTGVLVLFIE
ncbi:MAG: FIST N-terminal domain-containing protein [Thermodesulfobacteriota bacterium]